MQIKDLRLSDSVEATTLRAICASMAEAPEEWA